MRILIILLLALFFISEGLAQQQSEKTSGWYIGASSYSELGYFYPSDNLRELPFGFYNDTNTFTGYGFEAGYRHGKSLFGLSLYFGENTDERNEDDLLLYRRDYRSYTRMGFNFKRTLLSTKIERLFHIQLAGDLGLGLQRFIADEGTGDVYNDVIRSYEYPRIEIMQDSFFSSAALFVSVGMNLNSEVALLLNFTAVESYFGTASYGFNTPKVRLMVLF